MSGYFEPPFRNQKIYSKVCTISVECPADDTAPWSIVSGTFSNTPRKASLWTAKPMCTATMRRLRRVSVQKQTPDRERSHNSGPKSRRFSRFPSTIEDCLSNVNADGLYAYLGVRSKKGFKKIARICPMQETRTVAIQVQGSPSRQCAVPHLVIHIAVFAKKLNGCIAVTPYSSG